MIGIQRMLRKLRNEWSGNGGFTLIEVIVVSILCLMILAGMVVLLNGIVEVSKSSNNLEAVTDSSRRALSIMSGELRGALWIDNAQSSNQRLAFWADIRGNVNNADIKNSNDWTNAPEVSWQLVGDVIQQTTTESGTSNTVNLADYVQGVQGVQGLTFDYYASGSDINPINLSQYVNPDINTLAKMIRINITVRKGKSSRTLSQKVYLRVMLRQAFVSAAPLDVTGPGSGRGDATAVNANFANGRSAVSFISYEIQTPNIVPEISGASMYFDVSDRIEAGKPLLKVNGSEAG
jgi:type II secretory pathway pseudopilin PulG